MMFVALGRPLELRCHIRVVVQVDDESDVCRSKRHNGSVRKWIDAHGVGGTAPRSPGRWDRIEESRSSDPRFCNRRACGNRENGKRLTGVIHDRGNVGLRWSQKSELVVHRDTSREIPARGKLAGHRRR